MTKIYIIQGFLGAGKTTYSKSLAQRLNVVRLNGDEWCEAHFAPEKLTGDWDACFAEAIKTLWAEAEALLTNGQSVILDFGFWSRESRDDARSKAKGLGVPLELHYVYAPDDILKARITKRSGGIAESNLRNFAATKKFFEEPAEDEQAIVIKNF